MYYQNLRTTPVKIVSQIVMKSWEWKGGLLQKAAEHA